MKKQPINDDASNEVLTPVSSCSIEFKQNYSMKNGNKLTKKNWQKVVAISSRPCTNVHGVRAIDDVIRRGEQYFEKWKLSYEKDSFDNTYGYIFREVNHGSGISGFAKTAKMAVWRALGSGHITVHLEE